MRGAYHLDLSLLCNIEGNWFWLLWSIFALFTLYFLYMGYKSLLHAHAVKGTPTSKIRSAHQGYVELFGKQAHSKDGPLIGKLSKEQCTWYRYTIEHYNGKAWHQIEQGQSQHVFVIQDETGICYVDPHGADISTPLCSRWYGKSRYPKHGIPRGFFARLFGTSGPYRYTECRMQEGMPIYALGNFITLSPDTVLDKNRTMRVDTLLKTWEKKHQHLLSYLMKQNVHETVINTKDTLDYQAKKELLRDAQTHMAPTMNVISRHGLDRRQPFILSAHSQHKLTRGYQWDAFIWCIGFVGLFTLSAWLLQFRLGC